MRPRIKPICLGTLIGQQQAATTYLHGWGRTRDVPLLTFVIETEDGHVVVDTGASDPETTLRNHGYELRREPHQEPAQAFADAGVDPAAVELVIFTHLHWDHIYNCELFPNARFVVQQDELRYAIDPLEIHRVGYEKLPGIQPPCMSVWDRITTIRGDVPALVPGIAPITLPGHTPGLQGVLVEARTRRYVITSDCVDTYENWEGSDTLSHIPSAVHTSLFDYWESYAKLDALVADGWVIIPSHDATVAAREVFD